jgi:hypothetical protein
VLQPAAVDLANPAATARLGRSGFLLAVQAGGSAAVLDRYSRELEGAAAIEGGQETDFPRRVRDFAPDYLAATPQRAVARVSTTLGEVEAVIECTAPVAKESRDFWPAPGSDIEVMKAVERIPDRRHRGAVPDRRSDFGRSDHRAQPAGR